MKQDQVVRASAVLAAALAVEIGAKTVEAAVHPKPAQSQQGATDQQMTELPPPALPADHRHGEDPAEFDPRGNEYYLSGPTSDLETMVIKIRDADGHVWRRFPAAEVARKTR